VGYRTFFNFLFRNSTYRTSISTRVDTHSKYLCNTCITQRLVDINLAQIGFATYNYLFRYIQIVDNKSSTFIHSQCESTVSVSSDTGTGTFNNNGSTF